MKYFSFLILLIFFYSNGQSNIEIAYEHVNNGQRFESLLVFNDYESSFFAIKNSDASKSNVISEDDEERHVFIFPESQSDILRNLYKSVDDTSLLIKVFLKNDTKIVVDDLPPIDWEIISDDKKVILGFECLRATTSFRGSKISAYFTTSIPSPFGPDKFNGLPGIILEVSDMSEGFTNYYKAYSINFSSDKEIEPIVKDVNSVSLKDFLEESERLLLKRLEELAKKASSSMPRGMEFKQKNTPKRSGFEKIYEWEEEK